MEQPDINVLKNIEKLYKHNSLLDILIEIERFFDNFHLYAYEGWQNGIVVAGPKIEKYWVSCVLMFKETPDPSAGLALIKHGCQVRFKKGTEKEAIPIKTPDDYRQDGSKKPKMESNPVLFFEIKIPRRFIDEIELEDMDMFDDEIDIKTIDDENENETKEDNNAV